MLIDIDDTIEDLLTPWCTALNVKYGTTVAPKNITEWDIAKFFPALSAEQVFEPLNNDEFWSKVEPKSGAVSYVRRLYDEGYNVYLCSSTDYRNIRCKYEYIVKRYFPFIDWNHVIITANKQMIKADFLIDDGIHNLENGDYKKILMTMPYNKDYDTASHGMKRANNWREAYEIIHNSESEE